MKRTLLTTSLGLIGLLCACYENPRDSNGIESMTEPNPGLDMSFTSTAPALIKTVSVTEPQMTTPRSVILRIEGEHLNNWTYRFCGASDPLTPNSLTATTAEFSVGAQALKTYSENNTTCIVPYLANGTLGAPRLFSWLLAEPASFTVEPAVSTKAPLLSLTPKYGAISVDSLRHKIILDSDPSFKYAVADTEFIQDMTVIDMDRDRVPDLVFLTIDPLANTGQTTFKIKAYFLKGQKYIQGKSIGTFDTNTAQAFPLTTSTVYALEPKCVVADATARLAVTDLDEDGKLDITAQWYCASATTSGWSAVYSARQN